MSVSYCDCMVSLQLTWRLLLTYSMLPLWSWDRLMKTSQVVSRANGTTHKGLNNLQWWRRKGLLYWYSWLLVWWYGITSMDMEVVGDSFPASFVVILDRLMKTSQVSRANGTTHTHQCSGQKEGASLVQLVCVIVWYGMASLPWGHEGCYRLIPCYIHLG